MMKQPNISRRLQFLLCYPCALVVVLSQADTLAVGKSTREAVISVARLHSGAAPSVSARLPVRGFGWMPSLLQTPECVSFLVGEMRLASAPSSR